jgi:hypothetical protein
VRGITATEAWPGRTCPEILSVTAERLALA